MSGFGGKVPVSCISLGLTWRDVKNGMGWPLRLDLTVGFGDSFGHGIGSYMKLPSKIVIKDK